MTITVTMTITCYETQTYYFDFLEPFGRNLPVKKTPLKTL